MKKSIIFILMMMWLSNVVFAQYQTVKDIPYLTSGNKYALERCKLDVYYPTDCELELYGRYEEQAYFWRMLKLVGHQDVTLYEMQGYNHGDMPHPAYHILKETIKRLCH